MPSPKTLEEKQAEQGRLAKAYRANKRRLWAEFCEREPRILRFQNDVRSMKDPAAILDYLSRSWVRQAPMEARYYALRIIDKHAVRMARQKGGAELDDPLPPKRNLYIAAREMLAVR